MPIENPNRTFDRLFPLARPIELTDVGDEYRDVLKEADLNGDNRITRTEARDRLIQRSRVLADPSSIRFYETLKSFLLEKTGRAVDPLNSNAKSTAHVYYAQFNNAANQVLREATDLESIVGKDPDRPTLDTYNLTAAFNTEGDCDAATHAWLANLRHYFDSLIAEGGRLTGFIISGHSNGTDMLQETADHQYYANLDPRAALATLRQENPLYAELMNGCEKVGLLACFQGGNNNEWAELFPQATIAGTENFAPSANNPASASIYAAADVANQLLEDGKGDATSAQAAARKVSNAATLIQRGLVVTTPEDDKIARAQARLAQTQSAYASVRADVERVCHNGRGAESTDFLRRLYMLANELASATQALWEVQGKPGGIDGEQAQHIVDLRFTTQDLFAMRMGQARPDQTLRAQLRQRLA